MNRAEVAKLLTVASGYDGRRVDDVNTSAWLAIPAIREANYEDAVVAIQNHYANSNEYLMLSHVVKATQLMGRSTKEQITADVRSARARKLIDPDWPEDQPVPDDVAERLFALRNEAREESKALGEIEDPDTTTSRS